MAPGLCLLPMLLGLAGALPGALATQGKRSQLSPVTSPSAASLSGLSVPTCLGVLLPGKGVVGDADTDLPTEPDTKQPVPRRWWCLVQHPVTFISVLCLNVWGFPQFSLLFSTAVCEVLQ